MFKTYTMTGVNALCHNTVSEVLEGAVNYQQYNKLESYVIINIWNVCMLCLIFENSLIFPNKAVSE